MFCEYCGGKIEDDALFCDICGKLVPPEQHEETVAATENPMPEENQVVALETEQEVKEEIPAAAVQSESLSQADEENVRIQESPVTEEVKTESQAQNQTETFSVKNLFVQVFKKHSAKERSQILKIGMDEADESVYSKKIRSEELHPWFYSRVFVMLAAVFAVFEICLVTFGNSNLMPAAMITGSLLMPFTILTMYFELNVYKDISFYTTILYFALGGALSILATLFLYEIIPDADDFNLLGAMLVSIIEETGKAAVAVAIIKRTKNVTFLHGLLIGGAVGCGFAVFESAGYAFNVYLNAHDWNQRLDMYNNLVSSSYQRYDYANSLQEMNLNIFIRSILSFGGHTAWTAITGSYFAKEKKININFLKFFGICFALHAIWDTTTAGTWVKLAFLCIAAWYVIIKQISVFITEQNKTKAPV